MAPSLTSPKNPVWPIQVGPWGLWPRTLTATATKTFMSPALGPTTCTTTMVTAPSPLLWYRWRSEEHTSELQSRGHLVCRLLLEKKTSALQLANLPPGSYDV